MKPRPAFLHRAALLLALLVSATLGFSAAEKPRVFVLTDIENEPDDAMSLVRFLTYANQFEIEGLIATTSIHQRTKVAPQTIRKIVEVYGKVRDNLEKHEPGFPTGAHLLARVSEGLPVYGMTGVGEGKDSPGTGTLHIILAVTDHGTPRLTRYQRVIVTVVPSFISP